MFPGDPNGEPAEVINCRCVMKPMVASESPALAAHREKFNRDMGFDEWRENRLKQLTSSRNSGIMNTDVVNSAKLGVMPNAINASTTQNKLQGYLLNSNHPVGKHKAKVINNEPIRKTDISNGRFRR